MAAIVVETSITIFARPTEVWRYLCDARLPLTAPCCFKIGVPKPEACRLVGDMSGVGAQRQCQTDRGVINQTITEWEAPRRLSFAVNSDSIGLGRHIRNMDDTFSIEETVGRVRLIRRTRFSTQGPFSLPKSWLFRAAVKHVHRYVMRNFKALAEGGEFPPRSA